MPVRKLSLEEAAEYFGGSGLDSLHGAIREGARKGLYSAALRMVNEIQTRIIPETTPSPVDRSVYKAGWRAEETDDGALYENTVPHAAHIEEGVRPENVKVGRAMIQALTEWAARHGSSDPKRSAFAIAIAAASQVRVKRGNRQIMIDGGGRGIFRGGRGLKIMERANQNLDKIIREEVAREVERAIG